MPHYEKRAEFEADHGTRRINHDVLAILRAVAGGGLATKIAPGVWNNSDYDEKDALVIQGGEE